MAAFVEEGLKLEVLPWQRAILTRLVGRRRVEDILVRRVTWCMAQGLHAMGPGKCPSCGVDPRSQNVT